MSRYSNWRGPIWIGPANVVLAYALARSGRKSEALALARDLTQLLADDLRKTGHWHECYHSEDSTIE